MLTENVIRQIPRRSWYVIARATEIERALISKIVASTRILLFRKEDGSVAAISNLCPHRFAPLDRGTLEGDTVRCKYHGLEFDSEGQCVRNPHVDRIDRKMHVTKFPVVERYGYVWVWLGEFELADPELIPDLGAFEDTAVSHAVHSYIDADYRYDILVDNLLDLSHADYLHVGSFTEGAADSATLAVREEGDTVILERVQRRSPPLPFVPTNVELADIKTTICWYPGQVITFAIEQIATGDDFLDENLIRFFHVATPASAGKTHYFMGLSLPGPVNPEFDDKARLAQVGVIQNEDGPMLEAIDRIMDGRDLMAMQPLVLPVDAGAWRVRRVMKRLMAQEAATLDTNAQTRNPREQTARVALVGSA